MSHSATRLSFQQQNEKKQVPAVSLKTRDVPSLPRNRFGFGLYYYQRAKKWQLKKAIASFLPFHVNLISIQRHRPSFDGSGIHA